MIQVSTLCRVVPLCAAIVAVPAVGQVAPNTNGAFDPIPGERELSGRLIARPIQAEDARERGVDRAVVGRRADEARRALVKLGVERHFPEPPTGLTRAWRGTCRPVRPTWSWPSATPASWRRIRTCC